MKTKLQRFKEGMMNLTPQQQIVAQMWGYRGNIFGLLFAWVFLILKGYWYFSIVLFFGIFLQFIAYIGARQKYLAICQMQQEEVFKKL